MRKFVLKLKKSKVIRLLFKITIKFLTIVEKICNFLINSIIGTIYILNEYFKISYTDKYNIKIQIRKYSMRLITDIMMFLNMLNQTMTLKNGIINTICIEIKCDTENSIHNIFMIINSMNKCTVKNVEFNWSLKNEMRTVNLINNERNKEYFDGAPYDFFINEERLQLPSMREYFFSCKNNYLEVPHTYILWARSILKNFKPWMFIICIHIPALNKEDDFIQLENWKNFFNKIWENFPEIFFFILDGPLNLNKKLYIDMPNVNYAGLLGYNLLEEFALIKASDMFLGYYDKYAIMVIGTDKPFILIGQNIIGDPSLKENFDANTRIINKSKYQKWFLKDVEPMDFYPDFVSFYTTLKSNNVI